MITTDGRGRGRSPLIIRKIVLAAGWLTAVQAVEQTAKVEGKRRRAPARFVFFFCFFCEKKWKSWPEFPRINPNARKCGDTRWNLFRTIHLLCLFHLRIIDGHENFRNFHQGYHVFSRFGWTKKQKTKKKTIAARRARSGAFPSTFAVCSISSRLASSSSAHTHRTRIEALENR